MISVTKRLEVLVDGVSQGYVHLRLNGDLKITRVSKKISNIGYMLLNTKAQYIGFDFKSYETALEKGLSNKYKDQLVEVKENPLPENARILYEKSLHKTGRL